MGYDQGPLKGGTVAGMALYVVERDVSSVGPERLRLDQRDVASACLQLKAQRIGNMNALRRRSPLPWAPSP